jgi:acetyl esterase/lipase
MRLSSIPLLLVGFSLLAAEDTAKPEPKSNVPASVKVIRDIEYAKINDTSLTLDIYRPADAKTPLPTIVFFHGGGWRKGNKSNCTPAMGLPAKGYVVASINYRLSDKAIFPAAVHDCKGAIRFLRAHAKDYFIDPNSMIAMGDSAGGHLAALIGTSGGVKDLEGTTGGNLDQSSNVQAVIDYYGPVDFISIIDQKSDVKRGEIGAPEVQFIGGRTLEHKDVAIKASPLTYVSKDTPPFLIVHGDKDPRVPQEQPREMLDAVKNAGVEASLHWVKDGSHGFNAAQTAALLPVLLEFLGKHFKPAP